MIWVTAHSWSLDFLLKDFLIFKLGTKWEFFSIVEYSILHNAWNFSYFQIVHSLAKISLAWMLLIFAPGYIIMDGKKRQIMTW